MMARPEPYMGPTDTNDFDHATPEQASRMFTSYRLLGDCFEDSDDDDMFGRGWLIEDSLELLHDKARDAARAHRELEAAVRLARYQGKTWANIADATGLTVKDVRRLAED